MPFPMTELGGNAVSRLTIGTNTFHGFSHFSHARSEWLKRHFTPERTYEVLELCAKEGLNLTVAATRPGRVASPATMTTRGAGGRPAEIAPTTRRGPVEPVG